uniref:FeMo cofactor biosynthesis protein NifB n=1 Tax=Desulfovibrio desulfuricans (strain ATCC 27774 / DSM 6949 / MB) TaxID=525146 RepID=B8IY89_DESDA
MTIAQADSARHPCFNAEAHRSFGRAHLPVAAGCNVQCGFYDRRYSCVNESRPGVTARLLEPEEALEAALRAVKQMPHLSVIGIAGPGDPLADAGRTLHTLEALRKALPHILLCLSTNGLALPLHAAALSSLGVGHVTVTVNAVDPSIGADIYTWVSDGARRLTGTDAAALLLERQEEGIRRLKAAGVTVKINSVVIPGINDRHVQAVAQAVSSWGADLMNCIPLLPVQGTRFARTPSPDPQMMRRLRDEAAILIPQMRHCTRCRADALGLLGEEGQLEDVCHGPLPAHRKLHACGQ